MIEYRTVEIRQIEDYDQLLKELPSQFLNCPYVSIWMDELKQRIGTKVTMLLIEYPYYDSEYLSSYYRFYSKKFKNYGKKSCRIHFKANDRYMGYISLRPTTHYLNFSKSYLEPSFLIQDNAYIMLSEFQAHIYGTDYNILAFPWMNQQRDFSICAHVAVWEILKYYGNEHTGYRDITIGELVEQIKESGQRKLPSNGLNLQQIADIFRIYQATPIILKKEKGREKFFYKSLLTYVESGIPIVGALNSQEHAIAIIGHGMIDGDLLSKKNGLIETTDLCTSLIVNDDNYLPYSSIYYESYGKKDQNYYIDDIDFAVVPLYNRIHLEYDILYEKLDTYLKTELLKEYGDMVVRVYLTSATSLKGKTSEDLEMNRLLKDTILRLEMPKFVWCIDLSTKEEYLERKVSSKIIVDSTSCEGDNIPFLLIQNRREIYYLSEDKWHKIIEAVEPYNMYRNNLKEKKIWIGKN
ncbi:MAG: hypothetical protein SOX85_04665 [Lachnospiraceae bacterium]|nr:hypothetical protein [Lachnospiraceae bacterium]